MVVSLPPAPLAADVVPPCFEQVPLLQNEAVGLRRSQGRLLLGAAATALALLGSVGLASASGHLQAAANQIIGTVAVPAVVDNINGRFAKANPENGLWEAGVLIHQWDNMEGTGQDQMWDPCKSDWCADVRDRFSTSLVNAKSPRQEGGELGLFSEELGGFIVSPQAEVLCAYPADGGTMGKKCGPGDGGGCKPGCDAKMCTADMWWTCTFPPDMMGVMFQTYIANPSRYNEVVVSTASWDPPTSIEAFFYVAGKETGCGSCDDECEKVKQQHAGFLGTFALTSSQVPLLCLDASNWAAPFQDVSA